MSSTLEENLREASCIGNRKAVETLLFKNQVDVNSKNPTNGWTALHWAAKRGHEEITQILLNHGANPKLENNKGETPAKIAKFPAINQLLGAPPTKPPDETPVQFTPNYLKYPPLEIEAMHSDFSGLPTTALPATQSDELVLNVRISNSSDPDFIEIEIPRWKLTYVNLLKTCCEELQVPETLIERIRKLPNTKLRKDSDVKRLVNFQGIELVLKASGDKAANCYQSISTKDQTILY